ncbi:aminodeoxychorismate synthase component I [Gordonia malaquae]|uniref:aminodeoxychorismate synthase component I n=1 Tax=Gordonia malaquae TaxID=410332 RepID=UPI0030189AE2
MSAAGGATALDVVRTLTARTVRDGLPPPAALVGDWADADAVIAPSITIRDGVEVPDRPDRYWLGALDFSRPGTPGRVVGGFTDGVLLLRDGAWEWRSVDGSPCPAWVHECLHPLQHAERGEWETQWTPPDKAPHVRAIDQCLDAIAAGEVYQACVCTRFTGTLEGSALDFFCDVAAATRPAKAAWLTGVFGSIASFSPESFLNRRADTVTSSPIKGTVPAHADPASLTSSTKDVAENVMIVDLVRNDLGRVARTGSVTVPDLLSVAPAPGVWHLVSTVQATLRPEIGNTELLTATFPPASVTGTPKIRAAELLADWEHAERGVYCGAIGIAGPNGLLDLSVAIRTVAVTTSGELTLGVGGGITIDSDPDAEWQECLDKASSIVSR